MSPPLFDTVALAAFLGVPAATVKFWRTNGGGPRYVRLGRHVRYRQADVDAWLEARGEG